MIFETSPRALRLADGDNSVKVIDHRYLSPKLLILGSILGILGVVFTIANTLLVYFFVRKNPLGEDFESGHGYWPLTVSEAVSSADTPSNQVFFAFCLLGGLSIFLSWYPYHLTNANTADGSLCGTCIRINTLRQVLPGVCLILLAAVPMTAKPLQTMTDKVGLFLHGAGAGGLFVGYFACEFYALYIAKAHAPVDGIVHNQEAILRIVPSIIFILAFAAFGVCYVVDNLNNAKNFMCCGDEWKEISYKISFATDGVEHEAVRTKIVLFNTASGSAFLVKVIGYCGEIIAFMCMMINHVVIWYYCEERHSTYSEQPLAPPLMVPEDDEDSL